MLAQMEEIQTREEEGSFLQVCQSRRQRTGKSHVLAVFQS
jgi:hypothetical protein